LGAKSFDALPVIVNSSQKVGEALLVVLRKPLS